MNIFQQLYNYVRPMCPSGLNHRVKFGIVTNCNGNEFCWHPDCFKANKADVNSHIHNFKLVGTIYNKSHYGCSCDQQITE